MTDQAPIFDPIQNDGVADVVAEQIENLIISGVLKSGQRLPSEREIAEQMSVSRPKVRDAIGVLEERGILNVQHGQGTFVSNLTGTALSPAMIDLFARHPAAFGGYLEFRREVEGFAAFAAAHRATSDDIEIIKFTVEAMGIALENEDIREELRLDVQFHSAIVDATHNAMLIHTMTSIYELLARGVFLVRNMEELDSGRRQSLFEQHQRIGNAVISRDAEAAAAAAEAHINFVEASYREAQGLQARNATARKRRRLLNVPTSQVSRRARS